VPAPAIRSASTKSNALNPSLRHSPVVVGSGITPETIPDYLPHAEGFIVGTALKSGDIPSNPVDVNRVRDFVRRLI
jgi:predicted TIM-barrel enzyme